MDITELTTLVFGLLVSFSLIVWWIYYRLHDTFDEWNVAIKKDLESKSKKKE